jgi:hypothetical protein
MSLFFLIFFQKIKKNKLISLRSGLKKPFERDDFDFLIFFLQKKIKKSKSSLSAPSFSRRKKISEVSSTYLLFLNLFVLKK